MFVLIGLPIYCREWILPAWFAALEAQDVPLADMGFVFELGPDDTATSDILFGWHASHPEVRCFEVAVDNAVEHEAHAEGHRTWNPPRYAVMAHLRNRLLDRAICLAPDRYLSLDSDILLRDPGTVSELVRLTGSLDAVSPLTYMTVNGTEFPNAMTWNGTVGYHAIRSNYPIGTLFEADVIMAAVMMSRPVYEQSRYRAHRQGEDLGWSLHMHELGFKMWNASYLGADHVMHRSMLETYHDLGDPRLSMIRQSRICSPT
jgi:hypothetical protein